MLLFALIGEFMPLSLDQKLKLFNSLGPRVATRASEVLSVMTGNKVSVKLDKVGVVETNSIPDLVGDSVELSFASYIRIRGDLKGVAMFLIPITSARIFVDLLQGKKAGTTKVFDEIDRSAINETCNILSGAYLTELSNSLKISLFESVPTFSSNNTIKSTKSIISSFNLKDPKAVALQTKFVVASEETKGVFVLFFDSETLEKLKVDEK